MSRLLADTRWRNARWLVLAPHPDDETIGAGALISQAAQDGRLAKIAYLTDGSGSHPPGTPGLAAARRREAAAALRDLGAGRIPVEWLGWHDAHPHSAGSAEFERSALKLASIIRWFRIDAFAVTDLAETHCDHVAAYHVARRAITLARRRVTLFSYHIWGATPDRCRDRFSTRSIAPGLRRRALLRHRSQTSPTFGQGFRIPATMMKMSARDRLTLRSVA